MSFSIENDVAPLIDKFERLLGLSFKVFLMTSFTVMLLGIYIANLLFGNYSLSVLQKLRVHERVLTQEIEILKENNADLHKKYLEWQDAH